MPPLYIDPSSDNSQHLAGDGRPFLLKFYYARCKLFGENIPIYYRRRKTARDAHSNPYIYHNIAYGADPSSLGAPLFPSSPLRLDSLRSWGEAHHRGVVQRQNSGFISRRSGFESRPRNQTRLPKTTSQSRGEPPTFTTVANF